MKDVVYICRIEVTLFIEVATSMDNFIEIVTWINISHRSYNFDKEDYWSYNFDKISIEVVWIKFSTKIIDHLNDIIKLDSNI
jgi:hypothetical protein